MPSRFTDMRDTILVGLGCLVAALLVVVIPMLGVPLCTLALTWLTYRRGIVYSIVAVVLATVVVAVTGPVEGLLTGLVLVAAGPYAALALKKRSPWHVVGVVTVAVMLAYAGVLMVEAAASHTDMIGLMNAAGTEMAKLFENSASGTVSPSELAVVSESVRQAMYQWPAWLIVQAVFSALFAVYVAGHQARRAGVEVHALPPLEQLDLSWHLTWGVIGGLALLAVSRFMHQPDGATAIAGLNVMRVTGALLAIQGFAVFAGVYRKAGVGPVGRGIGYLFLVVTEPLTSVLVPMGLVGLTGLIDLWVNLRKLPRGAAAQPAEESAGEE